MRVNSARNVFKYTCITIWVFILFFFLPLVSCFCIFVSIFQLLSPYFSHSFLSRYSEEKKTFYELRANYIITREQQKIFVSACELWVHSKKRTDCSLLVFGNGCLMLFRVFFLLWITGILFCWCFSFPLLLL